MVCMESFLSLNGRISSHFHNIHLKLPYVPTISCSLTLCGQNMKILKVYFHDVITNELFFHSLRLEMSIMKVTRVGYKSGMTRVQVQFTICRLPLDILRIVTSLEVNSSKS